MGDRSRWTAMGGLPWLSFMRDAACPICNFRIYELTGRHAELAAGGPDFVAIFSTSQAEILRFAGRRPRSFPPDADPASEAPQACGIAAFSVAPAEGDRDAACQPLPTGMRQVGLAGLNTGTLMLADFLIAQHGHIDEAYNGHDAGDRMPAEQVEKLLPAACRPSPPRDLTAERVTGRNPCNRSTCGHHHRG